MPRVINTPGQFVTIGENIHTSRIVKRDGQRAGVTPDGHEAVTFKGEDTGARYLVVPDAFKKKQPYKEGNLKHFMIAVWHGVHGDAGQQATGAAYVHWEVRRQIKAGANYLDLNVDEVSYNLAEQKRSMAWLVRTVQQVSTVPPSIDSSNAEIIAEGLSGYDSHAGRPMLNSVALERLSALDLVRQHDARVIVTAAAEAGMPSNAEERLANIGRIVEAALSKGIRKADMFVDCLAFPISVAAPYGRHFLDAVALVRKEFGDDIHITGGISNVSFGLPKRRLVNDTFLHLAIDQGLDSGIINPLETSAAGAFSLDLESEPVKVAMDMLLGNDEYCVKFLQAYRAGKLG
jgi:5-methyltetrahydrofolate--homocysteine methyltransferase